MPGQFKNKVAAMLDEAGAEYERDATIAAQAELIPRTPEEIADSSARLKSYVDRIERLLEEVKGLQGDIADIKTEAQSNGFPKKPLMRIIKLRAMNADARQEEEYYVDLFKQALGLD